MRILFVFLLLALLCRTSPANEAFFYIGTMTSPTGSQGIYRGSIDTDTGKLAPLLLATKAENPNFLALSPAKNFLYATATDNGKSVVADFIIQPDKTLSLFSALPSGGEGACHVSVDPAAKNVFLAHYDSGSISCRQLLFDGTLGNQTAMVPFTGSGPNPKRQTKPYAHSIYADPSGKFVYACDLGTDHVWIFKLNATLGTLTPNAPPSAQVPPGNGPRHLAFSADGKFVYVVNEMGNNVTTFSRDVATGALTARGTVSALPSGTSLQGVTGAEIAIHPSGKWLYASTRGHDSIAVFAVASDGKLTLIQSASSVAKFPRSFAIDPCGHWLIAAGQSDNRIAVLQIDQATGQLTATDQSAAVDSPVCVLFMPKTH